MRIVLLNTHPLVRLGLRRVLESVLPQAQVDEMDDIELALRADAALIILDGDAAGQPPYETLARFPLAANRPALAVLMTSPRRSAAIACVEAGASAIIEKGARPEILGKALELVLAGGLYITPGVALATDDAAIDGSGLRVSVSSTPPALSPRQKEVVKLAAGGASNKEIARALRLAPATVKVHLAAALRAFRVRNRAELASAAARFGMVH
ncbi:MAG: response regulator transcription factor [Caulobacterales bacterium]